MEDHSYAHDSYIAVERSNQAKYLAECKAPVKEIDLVLFGAF